MSPRRRRLINTPVTVPVRPTRTPSAAKIIAVDTAASEVDKYDRSDGNVRFVWVWHEPPTIVPGVWNLHTSATRPWFAAPKTVNPTPLPGAPLDFRNPDISGDSGGGTHIVFEDRSGAVPRVRYRYWAPGNSPEYTNPTIDVVVCPLGACQNKATFLPRVITTTTVFDGILGVDAHIIFVAGTENVKDNEVWIARFRPPNAAAVQGPAILPADKTTNIAIVQDLDVIMMQDRSGETYASPGIGAAWTELRNVNTGIVHAAVSIGGNAGAFYPSKQDETDIQFQANKIYELPSIGFGPGGRLYVAFTEITTNSLKLRMYSVSSLANGAPTQRWELALTGGNAGMQVVIGVDRDLDLGSGVNSAIRISNNQIHAVCVWRVPSGSSFVYSIKYLRVADKSDRQGVWDNKEIVVDPKQVWAQGQATGASPYDFTTQPYIALRMTPENRVLLALSGKKDTGGSVQPMGDKEAVSVIGLNHLGAQEMASEAFVAPSATYDARKAHIVYRPGADDGSTGATYQLVYTRSVNFDSFIVYQEAPAVPLFG